MEYDVPVAWDPGRLTLGKRPGKPPPSPGSQPARGCCHLPSQWPPPAADGGNKAGAGSVGPSPRWTPRHGRPVRSGAGPALPRGRAGHARGDPGLSGRPGPPGGAREPAVTSTRGRAWATACGFRPPDSPRGGGGISISPGCKEKSQREAGAT